MYKNTMSLIPTELGEGRQNYIFSTYLYNIENVMVSNVTNLFFKRFFANRDRTF